jgi:hypothetical protein
VRHWYLDWEGPRPDSLTNAAAEAILRDREAAASRRDAAERDQPDADQAEAGGQPAA